MTTSRKTFVNKLKEQAYIKEQMELAVERADDKYLKQLIDNAPQTFDINFKTKEGHTLVMLSSLDNENNDKCTQLLIDAKADVTLQNKEGASAIDYKGKEYFDKFFKAQKNNNQNHSESFSARGKRAKRG